MPVVLGNNTIQIPAQIAIYLNLAIGETVSLSISGNDVLSSTSFKETMMDILRKTPADESSGLSYDPLTDTIRHKDSSKSIEISNALLGIDDIALEF